MKAIKSVFTFTCVVLAIAVLISPAYGAPKKMHQNEGAIGVQTGTSCVVGNRSRGQGFKFFVNY
jgi:hypothetical protein